MNPYSLAVTSILEESNKMCPAYSKYVTLIRVLQQSRAIWSGPLLGSLFSQLIQEILIECLLCVSSMLGTRKNMARKQTVCVSRSLQF